MNQKDSDEQSEAQKIEVEPEEAMIEDGEKNSSSDDDEDLEKKSSKKILAEIFDVIMSAESSSKSKKKDKHKKSKHHKKKKKHKDDKEKKKKKRNKSKDRDKSKHKDREEEEKEDGKKKGDEKFYEKCDTELIKSLDGGVKFDASKCDLFAAGELDSEEEKALSFDCFREKSLKRSLSPDEESSKKRKIEIQDLKHCSVSKLTATETDKDKHSSRHEEGEIPSSQDESENEHKSSRSGNKRLSRDRHSKERHKHHSQHDKSKKSDQKSSSRRSGDSSRSSRSERQLQDKERHRHEKPLDRSYSDRDRGSDRHRSAENRDIRGRRSRSRERLHVVRKPDRRSSREEERIDKKKLLAIAKKNATYILKEQQERMLQAGVIPPNAISNKTGKTVAELTEYCKKLVKSGSGSSDSESDSELSQGEGPTESFIHHPFQLRDRPNSIVMNIRNATQLPNKSLLEKTSESSKIRSQQYPVSSGQQHRSTEWVPVSPPSQSKKEPLKEIMPPPPPPPPPSKPSAAVAANTCTDASGNIDISSVISQKLSAMRKIQESSQSSTPSYSYGYGGGPLSALSGAFTGSTGARMLTPAELSSGQQAWARKDQLKTAAPVAGGMGMKLLQKMGWRPGEGLGKNKEGGLEPLNLDVKMDKKGLVAQEECRNRFQPFSGAVKRKGGGGGAPAGVAGPAGAVEVSPVAGGGEVFSGKHPVSALVELCTKKRWGSPVFELVFESGPDHKKNFLFKVKVNNREYQDRIAYTNKKQAKAMAAQYCLLQLGLIVVK
ncbi:Hypothetical predicted protein [Cloeon dipterum]|uniref:G-patch domain-containing protein n=1 Tax=Cloeon dipterum TaxID=197152 RepID=A0A8S1C6I1_9INSE|nr:Hypothetical predicted protein [Cloeon dipterum]